MYPGQKPANLKIALQHRSERPERDITLPALLLQAVVLTAVTSIPAMWPLGINSPKDF